MFIFFLVLGIAVFIFVIIDAVYTASTGGMKEVTEEDKYSGVEFNSMSDMMDELHKGQAGFVTKYPSMENKE